MKTCVSCKQEKPLDEFNKKSSSPDGKNHTCRECTKAHYNKHYKSNANNIKARVHGRVRTIRQRVLDYKHETGCKFCQENEPVCLDFHHTGDDKDFEVSDAVARGMGWTRMLVEIQKCIVVCSNCHRKIHAGILQ